MTLCRTDWLTSAHKMEQNMLPLWQPLSTVALILVVMETPTLEGYWDEDRPEGEMATGRGGGFSKTQGGAGQLRNPERCSEREIRCSSDRNKS